MTGQLYVLPAGSPLPTAADLAKLTPSALITGFALEATMHEKIEWSRITKHFPRTWRAKARPFPVEGGALFIVEQPTKIGTLYAIVKYLSGPDKLDTYHAPGHTDTSGSVFRTATDARAMIEQYAAHENTPLDAKPYRVGRKRYATRNDAFNEAMENESDIVFSPRPGFRQNESDYQ